jgi:hypothetical protein
MSDKKVIVDLEENTISERDLTAAELKQRENDFEEYTKELALKENKIQARKALLERLGLSEEEAKVLFG